MRCIGDSLVLSLGEQTSNQRLHAERRRALSSTNLSSARSATRRHDREPSPPSVIRPRSSSGVSESPRQQRTKLPPPPTPKRETVNADLLISVLEFSSFLLDQCKLKNIYNSLEVCHHHIISFRLWRMSISDTHTHTHILHHLQS